MRHNGIIRRACVFLLHFIRFFFRCQPPFLQAILSGRCCKKTLAFCIWMCYIFCEQNNMHSSSSGKPAAEWGEKPREWVTVISLNGSKSDTPELFVSTCLHRGLLSCAVLAASVSLLVQADVVFLLFSPHWTGKGKSGQYHIFDLRLPQSGDPPTPLYSVCKSPTDGVLFCLCLENIRKKAWN